MSEVAISRRDILAPSSATRAERGDDTYPTPPAAVHALLTVERFPDPIWEPAAGPGGIVQVLRDTGHQVVATTITDQGCPDCRSGVDFLEQHEAPAGVTAILTNPPFSLAADFIRHALALGVPRVVLRAASRKPRRPARREPAPPTLRAKGWHSLDELKSLMKRNTR